MKNKKIRSGRYVTIVDNFFKMYPQRYQNMSLASTLTSHFWITTGLFSSVTQSCPTLCNRTGYSMPGLPVHHQHPELAQTHVHQVGGWTSNHLILCRPLLLLPLIFPSIRVFSSESVFRIRWPKYWSFSFSISPSNEYSGLISSMIQYDFLYNWALIRG